MYSKRLSFAAVAVTLLLLSVGVSAEITPDPNERVAGKAVTLQIDHAEKGMMPLDFTLDDGTADNFIGDNGQFIWLNRFTPDPADFPFQLEQVSAIFGGTGFNVGDAIEIVIWSDTDGDGDPGTGAVLVASNINVTAQFNDGVTFNVYDLATPVLLNGPGDVLIGLINRNGSEGFSDFPAGLDQGVSAVRSWAATYLAGDVPMDPALPGDEQWGTIDSFGFPGNWVVRGAGTTVVPATPVIEVPTQDHRGLMAFGLLLLAAAGFVMWRRSR